VTTGNPTGAEILIAANWTFGRPPKHGRDPNDLVGPDN
jgi:hypothetical protein